MFPGFGVYIFVIKKQKAGNLRPHMEKPLRTCVLFLELSENSGHGQSERYLKVQSGRSRGKFESHWDKVQATGKL